MDYDKTLYRPFKIVNPDSFEVQYLLMKVVWNLEGRKLTMKFNFES